MARQGVQRQALSGKGAAGSLAHVAETNAAVKVAW